MKRSIQPQIKSKEFQRYHRIWQQKYGAFEASDWMAAHIGHLVATVGELQKKVKKLEKQIEIRHRKNHDKH